MKTILISQNDELIKMDIQFLADILPLGTDLCREILAYPLPITLTGGFSEVIAAIQEQVPTYPNPRGKFDLNVYVSPATGQPIEAFGHRLIREFEDRQREALYEKTGGKISEDITLEREAFLTSVKPKAGRRIVEALHDVVAYVNEHPDSAERCQGLLFFQNGSLKPMDDVDKLIVAFHSVYADNFQAALLEAVQPHFEALAEIAKRFDSFEAIKSGLFSADLLWLVKVGDDADIVTNDADAENIGDIGGCDQEGRPRHPNRAFTFE